MEFMQCFISGNRQRGSQVKERVSELKFVPGGKELVADNDEPTVFWEQNFKKKEQVSWQEYVPFQK